MGRRKTYKEWEEHWADKGDENLLKLKLIKMAVRHKWNQLIARVARFWGFDRWLPGARPQDKAKRAVQEAMQRERKRKH